MAMFQLGELLDQVSQFEERLTAFFTSLRDQSADNHVRLLTYYMARHRQHQQDALARLPAELIQQIRAITVTLDNTFRPEAAFYAMQIPHTELTGRQFLDAAVRYGEALVAFYRRILAEPLQAEAREMMASMVHTEQRDIAMMNKIIAMNYF